MAGPTRDWDAASYQRVSVPHEAWAGATLDRLALSGAETVLDAGCGSGRVTRLLVERLPEGRVVAVDGSVSMVAGVREVLRPRDEALVADLTEFELPDSVDAVFSSAVFHWVLDHAALFACLRAALRPGGRLVAQCGGRGNIERLRQAVAEIAAREPYATHLQDFADPWNYAAPGETEARLAEAGFDDVRCWLQPWPVTPLRPAEFLRTVCLGPYMDRLPAELRDAFVAEAIAHEPEPLTLEYVRLNIEARAGGSAVSRNP